MWNGIVMRRVAALLLTCTGCSHATPHVKGESSATLQPAPGGTTKGRRATPRPLYVDVETRYYYEDSTGLYVYQYAVRNSARSATSIDRIGIAPIPSPRRPAETTHWTAFDGYQGDSMGIVWAVTDVDSTQTDDGLSVDESAYNPRPGAGAVTFELKSPYSPGWVTMYAQGYEPMPVENDGESDVDEALSPAVWEASRGAVPGPSLKPQRHTQRGRSGH